MMTKLESEPITYSLFKPGFNHDALLLILLIPVVDKWFPRTLSSSNVFLNQNSVALNVLFGCILFIFYRYDQQTSACMLRCPRKIIRRQICHYRGEKLFIWTWLMICSFPPCRNQHQILMTMTNATASC